VGFVALTAAIAPGDRPPAAPLEAPGAYAAKNAAASTA
jgi:hypothetical protein